jgi:threonine-phosphate decarboxylase
VINLGHGANVEDMASRYHKNPKDILDFSANINPYKIEKLDSYVLEALQRSCHYPDIYYTELRTNLAEYLDCERDWVIPGNGATELMYLLMKCIDGPLAIVNPTFSEYERSARLNQIQVVSFALNKHNGFSLEMEEIASRIDEFESLFICNPNNPTGKVQNLKEILDLLREKGKKLIVDETFIEFVEDEKTYSLLNYIKDYPNLIMIRAATKFFGLPGIRLGYGVTSDKVLLNKMNAYKEPWTVNSFAEYLSHYMFKDQAYIERSKTYFKEERKRMLQKLGELRAFKACPTDTNFILIELKNIKAKELKERLFEKYNLLIRDASNFKGLDESFIRIAIKTQKENDYLIHHFKKEDELHG